MTAPSRPNARSSRPGSLFAPVEAWRPGLVGAVARRRGQATTEWMLLLAVIVVAVVAAGYGLAGTFADDMQDLGERASTVYASGNLAR